MEHDALRDAITKRLAQLKQEHADSKQILIRYRREEARLIDTLAGQVGAIAELEELLKPLT